MAYILGVLVTAITAPIWAPLFLGIVGGAWWLMFAHPLIFFSLLGLLGYILLAA